MVPNDEKVARRINSTTDVTKQLSCTPVREGSLSFFGGAAFILEISPPFWNSLRLSAEYRNGRTRTDAQKNSSLTSRKVTVGNCNSKCDSVNKKKFEKEREHRPEKVRLDVKNSEEFSPRNTTKVREHNLRKRGGLTFYHSSSSKKKKKGRGHHHKGEMEDHHPKKREAHAQNLFAMFRSIWEDTTTQARVGRPPPKGEMEDRAPRERKRDVLNPRRREHHHSWERGPHTLPLLLSFSKEEETKREERCGDASTKRSGGVWRWYFNLFLFCNRPKWEESNKRGCSRWGFRHTRTWKTKKSGPSGGQGAPKLFLHWHAMKLTDYCCFLEANVRRRLVLNLIDRTQLFSFFINFSSQDNLVSCFISREYRSAFFFWIRFENKVGTSFKWLIQPTWIFLASFGDQSFECFICDFFVVFLPRSSGPKNLDNSLFNISTHTHLQNSCRFLKTPSKPFAIPLKTLFKTVRNPDNIFKTPSKLLQNPFQTDHSKPSSYLPFKHSFSKLHSPFTFQNPILIHLKRFGLPLWNRPLKLPVHSLWNFLWNLSWSSPWLSLWTRFWNRSEHPARPTFVRDLGNACSLLSFPSLLNVVISKKCAKEGWLLFLTSCEQRFGAQFKQHFFVEFHVFPIFPGYSFLCVENVGAELNFWIQVLQFCLTN